MKHEQYITRSVELDIAHRVMHERTKCYSLHGHRVKVELTFLFSLQNELGYSIDFKEIKRIGGQWLEEMMDHGFIGNPKDHDVIDACRKTNSKIYLLSLNGENEYCNPTAENISREIFMAMGFLFSGFKGLKIAHVRFFETPNCWVDVYQKSIIQKELRNFYAYRGQDIEHYAKSKGVIEYDERKATDKESATLSTEPTN